MKILQLVYTLGSGGGERFVVGLSNRFMEMGHDVTIVQLRNDDNGEDIFFNKQFISKHVHYVNLGLTKGFKLSKALKVMKAIRKLNPDIVHTHLNLLPYIYPLAMLSKKIRFVHTLHNVAEKETTNKLQRKINEWFYKHNLIIPVTISEECRKSFIKVYGIENPVHIDNGCPEIVKTDSFEQVGKEIKHLKPTDDTKIFLHVARYNEQKNQKLLIDSFNALISNGLNAELIILGTGFDSQEGKKLKSTACERIHFFGTRKNVGDYMLNSDYFILSSLWEGLPISLIEAMSGDLTPISTPAGGVPNVITDGVNGFVSPDFTQEQFEKTIARALENPLKPGLVYQSYLADFSVVKCANEYYNIYNLK